MERSSDEQHQQLHLETRLKRLQEQIAALPAHFPWPGMTEKKLFVEKAHYLLEKAKALDSEVTALKFHQVQLTQDPSWTDQSWDSLENSISSLVKQISVSSPYVFYINSVLHMCYRAMENIKTNETYKE